MFSMEENPSDNTINEINYTNNEDCKNPEQQSLKNIDSRSSLNSSLTQVLSTDTADNDESSSYQNPDYFKNKYQEFGFIFSGMIGQLLSQAGLTQTLSIMNVLAKELDSTSSRQAWLMSSFPLALGSFILVSGRLGDIYGLKKILLGGYIITTVWSIICGLSSYAHNDAFFITARAFQGLGLAFALPNMIGLIGTIYRPGCFRKNMIISIIGAMSPTGATLGGLFAGLTVKYDKSNWPWSFYAFGLISFVNLIISWYCIPNSIPTNIHGLKMDWLGSVLGVFGLIILNFVFNQAPIVGWQSAYIIVLLVLSFCALVIFVVYEVKYAKTPLIPKAISSNRGMLMILFSLFCGWGSFGIWTFYYFSFELNLRHYSPLWAGSSYFIFVISGSTVAIVCGLTIKKIKPSVLFCCSMMGFLGGNIIFAATPVNQTFFRNMLGCMFLLPLGMDFSFPASSIILSDSLPMQYQGMAGSLVNTVINYSTSICLGMAGTVEMKHNSHGKDLLNGYRAAIYFAIGLAGLAVCVSGGYMIECLWKDRVLSLEENKQTDIESS
ncbi:hypothetical protein TBLA_0D03270 [Henningerozyma blattae CBS 6284]|uniref:Major facilitator superfamily (MFS) profile domain-containing protein n=1 Tax=Henningerozyma blattae (strain ATCC 34711 / CBS 6284 / DSM 70876 / NBRC 10599 / NRRL Y-10934 / UCD 77-7) TaxID=1071380 RepID=I2H375_HENB6|nr:hypothetical protein TBLA_0D03270 [Tetrapisispora blattae CBS 6284]CCH60827.1 hypothetical protein TBLA_0D03270 [Tetrapisispora blattae CBS 6284]